jgi:mannose-6-phosphate isomerase-like protein (cupin superfamily)
MQGYNQNIEKLTLENEDFRRVLYTSRFSQLVIMSLKPGEEIGLEVHDVDQFFRFEQGVGTVIIDGASKPVEDGSVVIVPAGAQHNVINASSSEPLKLYTLYCPPHHKDGTVHHAKGDEGPEESNFDGLTTEAMQ